MMGDLWIPDVSEYQTVDWSTFAGPVIVRAHNGNRADHKWEANAAGAERQPWWAAYQYLPAGVDAAGAALAFIETLGVHRPAATILDLEEGTGDQQPRQHAWLEVMAGHASTDWTYSGLYFTRSHNLAPVQWIAAYGQSEPTDAHLLWQATNAHAFPGIGTCDGSLFHGDVADLQALTIGAADMIPDDQWKDVYQAITVAEPSVVDDAGKPVNLRWMAAYALSHARSADAKADKILSALAKLPVSAPAQGALVVDAATIDAIAERVLDKLDARLANK